MFKQKECLSLLLDDGNAHTGTESNILKSNDELFQHIDFDDSLRNQLVQNDSIKQFNIGRDRHSQDKICNSYGNLLLNLCKVLDVYIVNERVGADKGVGKDTCKDVNLVDYAIASPQIFNVI